MKPYDVIPCVHCLLALAQVQHLRLLIIENAQNNNNIIIVTRVNVLECTVTLTLCLSQVNCIVGKNRFTQTDSMQTSVF